MKDTFRVTFTKKFSYLVEANNFHEAEDIALKKDQEEMPYNWLTEPYTEICSEMILLP